MNDRDELADLIGRNIPNGSDLKAADAILARWRLVPIEPPRHWPAYDRTLTCNLCHEPWPCAAYLIANAPRNRAAAELTHHDQAAGHYSD